MRNWRDLSYLLEMGDVQRNAYHAIKSLGILEALKTYDPILVGTVPIDVNVAGSDLDIVCCVSDRAEFEACVRKEYSDFEGFTLRSVDGIRGEALVVNFYHGDFEFELYAQNVPSEDQNAYRHMDIESKILHFTGDGFRKMIIEAKTSGIKTEPAFSKLLHLEGDPYEALFLFEGKSGEWIRDFIRQAGHTEDVEGFL